MKQWLIYRHTSLRTNKSYIGMTSQGITSRWNSHVSEASNGSSRHFHRAIRLYGTENWRHEILADNIDTIEEAYQLEKYYIKKYNTFENGYNLNEGGEGSPGLQLPVYFETHVWEHSDYENEECTGEELMLKFDLPREIMGLYLQQSGLRPRKQVNGWVIKGRHSLPKIKVTKDTPILAYHDIFGKFEGSVGELSEMTGKEIKHLSKLIKGRSITVAGWRLTEEAPIRATSNKKVYVLEHGKVINVYNSSFAASKALGLRKEQMSEWLNKAPVKIINGKIYCYDIKDSGDTNIGVAR